jgi:hypothetical protein
MADKPLFVTWNPGDNAGMAKAIAGARHSDSNVNTRGVELKRQRATAAGYRDVEPGVNVRDGFDRADRDWFRPGEAIPTRDKDIIAAGMQAYDKVGIVHNIIDMMAEFACQGIDLVHPNKDKERFFKEWFRKINGKERTERMLNMLYRSANVVVKRSTAKLTINEADALRRGLAADTEVEIPAKPQKREIPWRYAVLNPLSVEVINAEIAPFMGKFEYAVRYPDAILKKIKGLNKSGITFDSISENSLLGNGRGGKLIPLDPNKTVVFHYKKDDWQVWAKPMTYAVFKDLQMLEKLKLADIAALDGATSHVRLWQLGSLEHRIYPTETAISRLAGMLMNNSGGGAIDLIWGPELSFKETQTDLSKFLGIEKYLPTLNAIFAGLGIPPSMTGGTGANNQGFTNNYISLRTLIERLQYGRDMMIWFWAQEIRMVQQAMGFRFPAQLVFDQQTLSDEESVKRLYIELYDRGVITLESVREKFDLIPEIEAVRDRREMKAREDGKLSRKAGPWNNPEQKEALQKIALQFGIATPSEVGLELDEKKRGEKTILEKQAELAPKPAPGGGSKPPGAKQKGKPGQGRPSGKKDKQKRKKKIVKPRTSAEFVEALAWSERAYASLTDILHPAFLGAKGKKNMRALSAEDADTLERLKFTVLVNLPFEEDVTEDAVRAMMGQVLRVPDEVSELLQEAISSYAGKHGAAPDIEEERRMKTRICAMYHMSEDEDEAGDSGDDSSEVLGTEEESAGD